MGWSGGWLPLDGKLVGEPSAISRTPQLTHVFVRGTDNRLWTRFYAPTQWSSWLNPFPAWELFSSPTATSMGPDDLHVFAQGKNQALECVWWTADSGWHGPANLDGKIIGSPAAVVRTPGLCDVFARAPDNTLWQISLAGGAKIAVDWRPVSASWKLASSPSAGSMDEKHVAVFAQGKDQGLESMRWDEATGWHGPENHDGKIKDAPSVVCRKPGVFDVFARGSTDRLFEISWVDDAKIDWREVPEVVNAVDSLWGETHAGNTLTSSPAADTMGPEHVHVFARGNDNALWQKWWVGAGAPTVRLHLRTLEPPKDSAAPFPPIATMVKSMRQSYAGVWIDVASLAPVDANPLSVGALNAYDAGACTTASTSTDQEDLFNLGGGTEKQLFVYFVFFMSKTDGTPLAGCASHPSDQPGAVIASQRSAETLGHEVGHVLGLSHCDPSGGPYLNRRLMSSVNAGSIIFPPGDLVPDEFATILSSPLVELA